MNLTLLKDFLTYAAKCHRDLQAARQKMGQKVNAHSLFLVMFAKTAPVATVDTLINFMNSFHPNLSELSQECVNKYAGYKFISSRPALSDEQVLEKGASLLIEQWGSKSQLTYDQFSVLVKGVTELPSKDKPVQFRHKKALFAILQTQMQNLLDLHNFKKALSLQYTNSVDLFETITPNRLIEIKDLDNLFLMYQQRKTNQQLDLMAKRLELPLDYDHFLQLFIQKSPPTKHVEIKIYHSSKGPEKTQFVSQARQSKYQTPIKVKTANVFDSTALTKDQMRESLRRSNLKISQFTMKQTGEAFPNILIFGEILRIQEEYNTKKREVVIREDCDLELIYQRYGDMFQSILNGCYGVCNFSAFVRFLVPQNYEHRYLSFIRYKADNEVCEQLEQMIHGLVKEFERKECQIEELWTSIDKQLVFRGFCLPRETSIAEQQVRRYFTSREAQILLDRMDPHRTGSIAYENFN